MVQASGVGKPHGKQTNIRLWLKALFLAFGSLFMVNSLHATHGLAGNITYRSLGNNQYEITLTTYTNPCAAGVDRCSATIEVWGVLNINGVEQFARVDAPELINIPRSNGPTTLGAPFSACPGSPGGELLRFYPGGCIKKNVYKAIVTLRGGGEFEFRYSDFARVNGVVNMANSGDVSWFCSTRLVNNPFIGGDNSPILLNDPVDQACVGKIWSYNPAGFDPDGDSLSFSLLCSQNYDGVRIRIPICGPGYVFPDQILPGPNNNFTVNQRTGVVTWNAPQLAGIYNFALVVESYRGSGRVSRVVRDIAIQVNACTNNPPILSVAPDQCVPAGQNVTFAVRARDPDAGDSLYFYNTNGTDGPSAPFSTTFFPLAADRATLIPPSNINLRPQLTALQPSSPNPTDPNFWPISTVFSWTPKCNALSATPWRVDFYVHDNLNRSVPSPSIVNGPPLAANATVNITVAAPGLSNVTTQLAPNRSIRLRWTTAGVCPGIIGFEIYRSIDSLNQAPNTCCTDDPTLGGYVRIATVRDTARNYTDGPSLPFRGKYCYRIVAVYQPRGIGSNLVRSCASVQSCITLNRDTPVILNADVTQTDAAAGAIFVRWRQPNFASFNPVFFPPPYRYRLEIASGVGGTAFTQVAGATALTDSFFTVNSLNTVVRGYAFRVSVIDNNGQVAATSDPVSSIFLQATPQNRAIQVRWSTQAGFINDSYTLFRAPAIGGPFTQLAVINVTNINQQSFTFIDGGRPRGVQFCYFVRASGSYRNPQINTAPLINNSNRSCTAATDTIPPCLPPDNAFRSTVNCSDFSVTFTWNAPPDSCGGGIAFYNVYRKRYPNDPPVRIAQVPRNSPVVTFRYVDAQTLSPVGCYSFEAVDTVGNVSRRSGDFCVGDDCPQFQLPNVFTPNGDGANDNFTPITRDPFSVRGVRSVDTHIYDRTGRLVATSRDKEILWNGNIGGQPAPAGTYFYNIEITFESLSRDERIVRTGTITLLR
jgi:gliding motility-associated-like protein